MLIHGRECVDQHDLVVAILLAAGGVEAERLRPAGWSDRIADVVFPGDDWVFEVKSIEVDRPSDPSVQSQIGEGLARDAARYGGPIGWGKFRVPVSELPDKTAHNLMRKVGQSVQKAVDEANCQIKATRKAMGRPAAKGCVAIVSPPHELSPRVISWLVHDALRGGRNSAVNSVMIAQTPLLAPFGTFPNGSSYVAFPGVNGTHLPDPFKKRVGTEWATAHGQIIVESSVEEIDDLVQGATRRR